MSKYPEIFAGLNAPFSEKEVKTRTQAGRQLSYITARVVMNRLDEILGPENWWDEYVPMENAVLCRLSIRLPDGSVLCKSDAGGHAGMTDQGDDEKSGFSDAFKRAAVKFGVGRYLYRDGVPKFKPAPAPEPTTRAPAPPRPASKAGDTADFKTWCQRTCEDINGMWLEEVNPKDGRRNKSAPAEIVNPFQLSNHLLKWIKANGIGGDAGTAWAAATSAFDAEAKDYCRKLWIEAKAKVKVKPPREPGDDDDGADEVMDRLAEQGVVT